MAEISTQGRLFAGWRWPEALALVFATVLVQVPQLAPKLNDLAWLGLSLAPLWAATLWSWAHTRARLPGRISAAFRRHAWLAGTFVAFVLLQLLAFYRGGLAGATPLGPPAYVETILAFGLVILVGPVDDTRSKSVFVLVLLGLWTVVAANVAGYAFGLRSPGLIYAPGEFPGSRLFRLLGSEQPVILFPLASGVNAFGSVVGAVWVSGWVFTRHTLTRWARLVCWAALTLGCLALLFFVDSRGAILFGIIAIGLLELKGKPRRWLAWTPLAPLVLPVLLIAGIHLIPAGLIEQLQLGKPETVYALSGRTEIWQVTVQGIMSHPIESLFGYGYAGHLLSGLSSQYGYVMVRPADTAFQGPHNLVLQLVLDIGLVGTGIFLAMAILALRRILALVEARTGGAATFATLGVFVYMFCLGSIERLPTVYSSELFVFLVLIVMGLLAMPGPDRPTSLTPDGVGAGSSRGGSAP